jgi:phosphoserine aminotransferase
MKLFFTPGPSKLHDRIPEFINEALKKQYLSISHRSAEFSEFTKFSVDKLRELMQIPVEWKIFFVPSATEAMERIIQNTVLRKSTHFVQGSFGERFYKTSLSLNKSAETIMMNVNEMPEKYFDKVSDDSELICITQNETSTGSQLPFTEIKKVKQEFPEKLIAVDMVSSAPQIQIDFEHIDMFFFSVQKAFGMPAGLGVIAINPVTFAKSQQSKIKKQAGDFHDFGNLDKYMQKYQTAETPNVLGIFLLGKVCDDFLNSDINIIRQTVKVRAIELYDLFEKVEKPNISLAVSNKPSRSETIIVVNTGNYTYQIIDNLKKLNIEIGNGYGDFKDSQIRIANFPTHTQKEFDSLKTSLQKIFS